MSWIGKIELRTRYRLGGRSVERRGAITRDLEQPSTVGLVRASDLSFTINDEFGFFSPNQRDGPFNNVRLFNAPVRVAVGIPSSEGTQWLPMGKWYVDEWGNDSKRSLQVRASDLWRMMDEKVLISAFTTLGSEVNTAGTSLNTIVVGENPSTAGFSSSGTLKIDGEFVTYSGTTANSFTGVNRAQANTEKALHPVYSPVRQAFINIGIDDLMKKITDSASIGTGEASVGTAGRPEIFYQSDRRILYTTNGSVVQAQLVGMNGGYGMIGGFIPTPLFWGAEAFGMGRRIGPGGWGFFAASKTGLTTDPLSQNQSGNSGTPIHLAVFDEAMNQVFGARNNVGFDTPMASPPLIAGNPDHSTRQVGVMRTADGLFQGAYTIWWRVYYGGLDMGTSPSRYDVTYQLIRGYFTNQGVVSVLHEKGSLFGSPQSPQHGPASCHVDGDDQKLYIAYYINTTVVIDRYDLDSDGVPSNRTTVYTAAGVYQKATGICTIPAAENPLAPGSNKRIILAAENSSGEPVLVLFSESGGTLTVRESAKCGSKVYGLTWKREQGSPSRSRLMGVLGGLENQVYAGNQPQELGYVASFDMGFPHMQVRRTTDAVQPAAADPVVYRNGAVWVENTDYRFERGINYSMVSFEHLLTTSDLLTATYDFRFSVANADFAGMRASEAMMRAAAIPMYWLYFDESERLVFKPRIPSAETQFIVYSGNNPLMPTRGPGQTIPVEVGQAGAPLQTPNVISNVVRQAKDAVRNRVKMEFTSARTGEIGAIVIVDESILNSYSGTQLRTADLYGTKDFEVSNEWVYNLVDARTMASHYLQYLSLRADFDATLLFQPHVQNTDTVLVMDGILKVGIGSSSYAVRPTAQLVSLTHDMDSRETQARFREI